MSLLASTMSMFDSSVRKNGHSRAIACSSGMPGVGCAASHALHGRAEAVPAGQHQPASAPSRTPTGWRAGPRSASTSCARPAGCRCAGWRSRRSRSTPRNSARSPASRRPARDRPGRRGRTAPPWRRGIPRAAPRASRAAAPLRASRPPGSRDCAGPVSGLAYLPAITSPCSVTRMPACTAPSRLRQDRLVARAAAAADRAAAAVEQAQLHAVAAEHLDQRRSRPCRAPSPTSGSRRPCCCRSSRA